MFRMDPDSPPSSDEEDANVLDLLQSNNFDMSLNILIIEDFKASSTIMSSSLKFCRSATCVVANSGAEALEILVSESIKFDVILTDVMMPNMTGIELIGKIRALEIERAWNKHIIIAMSADAEYSDDCMTAGATLFLHKHKKPMLGVFKVLDDLRNSRRSSI